MRSLGRGAPVTSATQTTPSRALSLKPSDALVTELEAAYKDIRANLDLSTQEKRSGRDRRRLAEGMRLRGHSGNRRNRRYRNPQ
jgi:hypothetical protein